MFGFTFKGRHSSEFGLRVLKVKRAICPPLSLLKQAVPRMIGEHYFGKKLEPITFEFEILFVEQFDDYMGKVRSISDWLSGEELSDLSIDDEPTKVYKATLQSGGEIEELCDIKKATLTFYVPKPVAYGNTATFDKYIRDILVYARTGSAEDADGALKGINTPRYSSGHSGKGLLIEEGTTNLLLNPSFEKNEESWTPWGAVTFVSTTRSSGTKAVRVSNSSGVGESYVSQTVSVSVATGDAVVFSGYLKNLSGDAYVLLDFLDSVGTRLDRREYIYNSHSTLTRVSEKAFCPAGTTAIKVWLYSGWNNVSIAEWDDVQLEKATHLSTWTNSTRQAESLTLTDLATVSGAEGTIHISFYENNLGLSRYICDTTASSGRFLIMSDGTNYICYMNGNSIMTAPMVANGWHRISVTWSGLTADMWIDGSKVATYTSETNLAISNISNTLLLGCNKTKTEYYNTTFDSLILSGNHSATVPPATESIQLSTGDLLYRFEDNLNVEVTDGYINSLKVTLEGTLEAEPSLTITSDFIGSEIVINNLTTNKTIRIIKAVSKNDVIVVDFSRLYVTINGNSAMAYLDIYSDLGDFFQLGENELVVSSGSAWVELSYKSRWI